MSNTLTVVGKWKHSSIHFDSLSLAEQSEARSLGKSGLRVWCGALSVNFRARCQSCSRPQGSGAHEPGLGQGAPSQSPPGSWGSTSALPLLCLHQSAASRSLPWCQRGGQKGEVRGGRPLPQGFPRLCECTGGFLRREQGLYVGAGGVPEESSESPRSPLGGEGWGGKPRLSASHLMRSG